MAVVDVLLPVYNGEAYVSKSIESVLSQTLSDFRLIIIDDGSTDKSLEIAQSFADKDQRISIHQKENSGLVETLNFGLALADAEFVARHDADDLSFPSRFESQVRHLKENDEVIATSCRFMTMDDSGAIKEMQSLGWDPMNFDVTAIPADEPFLPHPFMMLRTDKLKKIGGYRHVPHSEDADLWWRLVHIGRLTVVNEVLGVYRRHNGSVSNKNARVQSATSQLAALSFIRRASYGSDLTFNLEREKQIRDSTTIQDVIGLFREEMREDEYNHALSASQVKLLIFADSRPISLAFPDIFPVMKTYRRRPEGLRFKRRETRRLVRRTIGRNLANLGFVRAAYLSLYLAVFMRCGR